MQKKIILAAVSIVLLYANSSLAVIANSSHDFSSATWNNTEETCIVCHAPHNAQASEVLPLWNHEAAEPGDGFKMYVGSSTFDGGTISTEPSGVSQACLGCHDGTVALDSFGGNKGTNYTTTNIGGGNEGGANGGDLSNDHPISFVYKVAADDDDEIYPATAPAGDGTIQDLLVGSGDSATLECPSCHDVHGGISGSKLLVVSNDSSRLCLTCHEK